ncbi:MAG TPA: hypothetical protein VGN63_23030 [Flavisolibacter sp.]|jgi:DNA/RNA endonuclease YhcR with UshA esterase domain|nr:hypothetical protein [Flavisolibacter sp.]
MKQLLTILVLLLTLNSFGQKQIELKDIQSHLGDTVKVCGMIYSGKYLSSAKGTPTFLNMGAEYPNQLLTIVIWAKEREAMKNNPETELVGKEMCLTGKVEQYKGKLQIVLRAALNKQ